MSRSDVERFWARVRRGAPASCWLWDGPPKPRSGYGQFGVQMPGGDGKRASLYAHRIAYVLSHGPIPEGQEILHACDVPLCCNPSHLSVGTRTDNMRDASAKGRLNVPRPGRWRVSDDDVEAILAAVAGGAKQSDLASRYGVSAALISAIVLGKRRQHRRPSRRERAA